MKKPDNMFEKPLALRLKGSLNSDEINHLAKTVSILHQNGIKVDDIFPYGVPAQPDSVTIRANLSPEQLKVIGEVLPKLGPVKDFHIFPRGIVSPEVYRLHVNVLR